jgi:hypothetical protein
MDPTGFTGMTGPIGVVAPENTALYSLFPSAATGPVEPPHIVTMDELMASLGAIVTKEAVDKQTASILLHETRETLRAPLFQWAAIGFPDVWVVQTFTLDPPPMCSDGAVRGVQEYFNYCLGRDINDVIEDIRSKMVGVSLSISFQGNTLRLHVSK